MYTDNPSLPARPAAAAIDPFILVKLSSDTYAVAGASDHAIGATTRAVKLGEATQPRRPSAGSLTLVASAAIVPGAEVVQAENGKVKTLPTSGGGTAIRRGIALTPAGADGDWIEVEPHRWGDVADIPT